ncbi:hypothetical protein E7Z59_05045 [Robertkochia marina]|uniref:Uncharacterized protein n=1 Tax=Robertkochia marina TaxID=1227945 RepID=A0A4S3M4F6_9FLAO|nr:hypothetical protein [Robertkochia marina]THD69695.1 hypothetical protein E7Z59_05045 [Robertkochia marina]TRZ46959.1 hypothetical protein D3A96_05170 [Robertkochia marina]
MGKKKEKEKKVKKEQFKKVKKLQDGDFSKPLKSKCCKKYKKSESKRCKRCPCFDLLKKVA